MVDHDNLSESASVGVTAVVLTMASVVALFHLYRNFNPPHYIEAQKYLIPLFSMPILIGWSGWIEIMETKKSITISFTINLFKAFCLASFMMYTDKMLGWETGNGKNYYSEEKKLAVMCTDTEPKCLLRCIKFKPIRDKEDARNYLFKVKVYVFQFCACLMFIGIVGGSIMLATEDYETNKLKISSVWLWFYLMQLISSVFALLYLLNFGMFVNKIPEMATLQILHKFVIIKLGILFTELQPLVISVFSSLDLIASTSKYSKDEITLYTNSLLLCSEMILMSFLLILIFPVDDYSKTPDLRKSIALAEDFEYVDGKEEKAKGKGKNGTDAYLPL
jgi:hypothetical protein